jgi:tetratricopeptide (TPR) repeat protein
MEDSRRSATFIAVFSALIFISHPIQTQAVTYIVQRGASMATLFYLLSLNMYIASRLRWNAPPERKSLWIYLFYGISLLSSVCAMKTKEISFTLPFMVMLYEFFFFSGGPDSRRTPISIRFLFLVPLLLTLLIIPVSMLYMKGPLETIMLNIDTISREAVHISRTDYLLTQFRVIVTYLRLLIFPLNQNFDYEYPVYHSFFDPQVAFSFIFLCIIFLSGIYLFYVSRFTNAKMSRPGLRLTAFGIFWFFLALSVESSIVPITDVIVEHRLYLPSIGLIIAFVTLFDSVALSSRIKVAVMIGIVLLLSAATYNRNILWRDPQLIWEDVIVKAPGNYRAYNNLGVVFKKNGKFDEATKQFQRSIAIDSSHPAAYFNLGDVQYQLGNYAKAEEYLKKALDMRPNSLLRLDILNKLGRTYSAMGKTETAIAVFEHALTLYPSSIPLYNNLGIQYVKVGNLDAAINIFQRALTIGEAPEVLVNLVKAYALRSGKQGHKGSNDNFAHTMQMFLEFKKGGDEGSTGNAAPAIKKSTEE